MMAVGDIQILNLGEGRRPRISMLSPPDALHNACRTLKLV